MTYWIGRSTLFLPKVIREFVTERLLITEVNNDISVITEPGETFCFYFSSSNDEEQTLLILMKICRNLSKSLVVFHDGTLSNAYLSSDLIFDNIDITTSKSLNKTSLVIQNLEKKFHLESRTPPITPLRAPLTTEVKQKVSHNHDSSLIASAIDYIEKHFTSNIREIDIASHCHLSPQYFSRIFHKRVGSSFRDYLSNKRLEHAKKLLLDKEQQRISSIAYDCGFNDVSYFSRVFKKKTGMSPGTYRNFRGGLEINKIT
ncbi:helix-turn-helix domain-containing protein [Vibrio sp. 10N.222.51.C12]|uniref:helix-turn-helix domain-containing protein n=1 Tax=unclassified Vibrio TaxID=2614977 RepID=UPI000C85EE0C|nr:AraC family transcriptional regulator [Vibrio sp. 10N.286.48.B7]PMH83269.1 hypothetical protein BCU58_01665 [Vibrio sp. 10N.286.48.B7]